MTGLTPNLTAHDITTSGGDSLPCLCRTCLHVFSVAEPELSRCPKCHTTRLIAHRELHELNIAHIDCDAFFAAIEKRDDPSLRDKPVIIGGGARGVVATCCYVARISGVRSAMPMFKAKQLCPHAVIIRPDLDKYVAVGHAIRTMMQTLTPLVQAISIDEAFLDLHGTQLLHHATPAQSLARLAAEIEREQGVSVSVGLSYNKFLAKLASERDKPRGFFVIGQAEAKAFLASQPIGVIWGIGRATQKQLEKDGITHIAQLQKMEARTLAARYGELGLRLAGLVHGEDKRIVSPHRAVKSISSETTFAQDINKVTDLEKHLWHLSERTAQRCKAKGLAGKTIIVKMKTSNFTTLTRSHTLGDPTQLADVLFVTGRNLLRRVVKANPAASYRLIGIGVSGGSGGLIDARFADPIDLGDPEKTKRKAIEQAIDSLREKFGRATIGKGRGL